MRNSSHHCAFYPTRRSATSAACQPAINTIPVLSSNMQTQRPLTGQRPQRRFCGSDASQGAIITPRHMLKLASPENRRPSVTRHTSSKMRRDRIATQAGGNGVASQDPTSVRYAMGIVVVRLVMGHRCSAGASKLGFPIHKPVRRVICSVDGLPRTAMVGVLGGGQLGRMMALAAVSPAYHLRSTMVQDM